jgi:hypothetical protein
VWLLVGVFHQMNHLLLLSVPLLISQAIDCLRVAGCNWDDLCWLVELLDPPDCDKRREDRNTPHNITHWHPSIEWKSSDITVREAG